MKIVIVNGFDRCGATAISKTLALHPKIELIFQPFNSGSIRTKINRILTDEEVSTLDTEFFENLDNGKLQIDYIKSEWFEKYSTTRVIQPRKINILKTTINHLSVSWIQSRFPNIEFWGIWRNPYDILASLIRNDYYHQWFQHELEQLIKTLRANQKQFPSEYLECVSSLKGRAARAMSWILAVRSYYFFKYIEKENVLVYEDFVKNQESELSKFTRACGISGYPWNKNVPTDLNVTGKHWETQMRHIEVIPSADRQFIDEVFRPLLDLGIYDLEIQEGLSTKGFK